MIEGRVGIKNKGLLAFLCLFLFVGVSAQAQSYYDGIRVCWDYRSAQSLWEGVYSRLKVLSDGRLVCVYSAGSDVYIRRKRISGWDSAIKVASDASGQYHYTNSELLELADGRLMYAWNARANEGCEVPYKIMASYSSTKGLSWRGEQTLYVAGTDWNDGCWEPAMMQLPNGEVQLFFANEHNVANKRQNISMRRSLDNCNTWQEPEVVCFRETSRDGMPVPVCLQEDKGLVFAIEDNGINGNFKPVIIHSTMDENWKGGIVGGNSSHRWSALKESEEIASSVYAGAPYLIQLSSGETLLSCQSAEGRESNEYPIMQVYVGNASARNFCCRSTPLPFINEPKTTVQWNGLVQLNDSTVMATSSVSNRSSHNGIWAVTGHIYHPLKAYYKSEEEIDWSTMPVNFFIGAESQAQARIRTAWNNDSLFVHFQVYDNTIVTLGESEDSKESDGVEILIDRTKRGGTTLSSGIYQIVANADGRVNLSRYLGSSWISLPSEITCQSRLEQKGYVLRLAIPWSDLSNIPNSKDLALCFRLHNNDNTGIVYHENMSGANPEKPMTWMKCTLLDQSLTAETKISFPAKNTSFYTLNGFVMGTDKDLLPPGLYVSKGHKILK